MDNLICIAKITTAHGIKGYVKLASFTENPSDIKHYSHFLDKNGQKKLTLKVMSMKGQAAIASVEGVTNRNDAEALRHTELYISRDELPDIEEGAFYWEDLKGLAVQLEDGSLFGKVVEMHNFGAGDIIEIKRDKIKNTELFSFNEQTVIKVDLEVGVVTLSLPEVVMVASAEEPKKKDEAGNDN